MSDEAKIAGSCLFGAAMITLMAVLTSSCTVVRQCRIVEVNQEPIEVCQKTTCRDMQGRFIQCPKEYDK